MRPFLSCLALLIAAAPAFAELFVLDSVRMENVPHVKQTAVSYTIDLNFKNCPPEYWTYYDTLHQSIVIDCYNATIEPHSLVFGHSDVFKGVSIKNLKTEFALSGERSQIYLEADPGWHIEATTVGTSMLRVSVWRQLRRDRLGRGLGMWVYVLSFAIPIVVGVATLLIISSASK